MKHPAIPDYKAKAPVFDEIIRLMVVNKLSVNDITAYIDAVHVMSEYVRLRKESKPASMEELTRNASLEIAGLSTDYAEFRVFLFGAALESLTR